MSDSKRDLLRACIKRRVSGAIAVRSAEMINRTAAEAIRVNRESLASAVAFDLCEQYRFLELCDIFEWKRERVRR